MNELKASLNLDVEINNTDLLTELNAILAEHSLTLEQFILFSINKTILDIKYMNNIRDYPDKK